MELDGATYQVSFRKVKYPRLELKTGELIVILPFGHRPETLLAKHRDWISKKCEFIKKCLREAPGKKIIRRTEGSFRQLVQTYIEEATRKSGVKVNKVYLRRMKTKWASCSPKRNLTINLLVKFLPERLIRYIIFHEIAHLIEKRHNDKFWKIMSAEFGPCGDFEKELFAYWFRLQRKEPGSPIKGCSSRDKTPPV